MIWYPFENLQPLSDTFTFCFGRRGALPVLFHEQKNLLALILSLCARGRCLAAGAPHPRVFPYCLTSRILEGKKLGEYLCFILVSSLLFITFWVQALLCLVI